MMDLAMSAIPTEESAVAVTEIRRSRGEDNQSRSTFSVKANGLQDLFITTDDNLIQFSPGKVHSESFLACPSMGPFSPRAA
jgi:hypothetical protein